MRSFAIIAASILCGAGVSAVGATVFSDTYALSSGLNGEAVAAHWDACRHADDSSRSGLCSSRGIPLGRREAGLEIATKTGDETVILVPGAPGNDYYWKVTRLGGVEQVGSSFIQEVPKDLVLLRSGRYVTVFRFKAVTAGRGEIVLSNVRLGAGGGDATEVLKYRVRIG